MSITDHMLLFNRHHSEYFIWYVILSDWDWKYLYCYYYFFLLRNQFHQSPAGKEYLQKCKKQKKKEKNHLVCVSSLSQSVHHVGVRRVGRTRAWTREKREDRFGKNGKRQSNPHSKLLSNINTVLFFPTSLSFCLCLTFFLCSLNHLYFFFSPPPTLVLFRLLSSSSFFTSSPCSHFSALFLHIFQRSSLSCHHIFSSIHYIFPEKVSTFDICVFLFVYFLGAVCLFFQTSLVSSLPHLSSCVLPHPCSDL